MPKKSKKHSPQMARVLHNLANGLEANHHCRSASDYGGLSGTMLALRRQGLVDNAGQLTEAGRDAVKHLLVSKDDEP